MATGRAVETPGERCRAFWDHLIARHPIEQTYSKAMGLPYRWRELGKLRFVVAQYIMFEQDQVGVYVRGEKGSKSVDVQQRLEPFSLELSKLTGCRLGVHFLFHQSKSCRANDEAHWDKMVDWLHHTANSYQDALQKVMG